MLVVDDVGDWGSAAALQLDQRGHDVRNACIARAMRTALEFSPDVVVAGVGQADALTHSLMRQLRMLPALARIRLVAVSERPSADVIAESAAAYVEFFRCIHKPVNSSALFAAVENQG